MDESKRGTGQERLPSESWISEGLIRPQDQAFLNYILRAIKEGYATSEEIEAMLREVHDQTAFERLTQKGFEDFKSADINEFHQLLYANSKEKMTRSCEEGNYCAAAILAGRKERFFKQSGKTMALTGFNLSEVGGLDPYHEPKDRPFLDTLKGLNTGLVSYTGIGIEEPLDHVREEGNFSIEHHQLWISDVDQFFDQTHSWEMIFAIDVQSLEPINYNWDEAVVQRNRMRNFEALRNRLRKGGIMCFAFSYCHVPETAVADLERLGFDSYAKNPRPPSGYNYWVARKR